MMELGEEQTLLAICMLDHGRFSKDFILTGSNMQTVGGFDKDALHELEPRRNSVI